MKLLRDGDMENLAECPSSGKRPGFILGRQTGMPFFIKCYPTCKTCKRFQKTIARHAETPEEIERLWNEFVKLNQ